MKFLKRILIIFILFGYVGLNSNAIAAPASLYANNSQQVIALLTVAFDDYETINVPKVFATNHNCLTMGEMVSMLAGAVVGGATVDFMLNSTPLAIIGVAAGAALGSILYRYDF